MSRLILIVVWFTIATIYTVPTVQAYEYKKPVTYNRIGNTTYGSDGSTERRIGSSTYITDGNGSTTTCREIGSITYCN